MSAAPVRVSFRDAITTDLTFATPVWDNPEDDSDDFTAQGATSARFDAAARMMLDAPAGAKVTVTMSGGSTGTDYTREDWESFSVAAGGRHRDFASMPDLIAALDVAEAGGPIGGRAADLLGQRVLADFGGGATFEAEVVGATPHAVTLRGRHDGRPRERDARYGHPYRVGGATGVEGDLLLWADPSLTALTPIA